MAGIVISGLLAYIGSRVGGSLWWLCYGVKFDIGSAASPLVVDLSVIKLTLALAVNLNVGTAIGILAGMLTWKFAF